MERVFFSFGPITIYWYSIMILLAVIAGMIVVSIASRKSNMKDYFDNLIFYLIIFGVIGARLYYVAFEFDSYKHNLIDILKVWEGGLAIYGGIIAGIIVTIFFAKKYKQNFIKTTDILVLGLILAQAIGRWGNFFNHEAHGGAVARSVLENLHIPKFIIEGMYIEGIYYHPTFLYESLWCILGFIILLIVRKMTKKKEGVSTGLYFVWYGVGRFFIEGLRTDSLYVGSLRISQIVSIIMVIVGIVILSISIGKKKEISEDNGE